MAAIHLVTVSYFILTARTMPTDHHIHYYDARSLREPLFVLRGHDKAVSHVQFLDSSRLVSAYAPFMHCGVYTSHSPSSAYSSIDGTLRLWDVNTAESLLSFSRCASLAAAPI